jgi:hypothetical protein
MNTEPFYTKLEFVKLLREKRGTEYALGWLEMAYALPALTLEQEMKIVQREAAQLQGLPNWVEPQVGAHA